MVFRSWRGPCLRWRLKVPIIPWALLGVNFSYEADQSARLTPKGKDGRSAANAALYFTSYIKGFVTQIWIIGH